MKRLFLLLFFALLCPSILLCQEPCKTSDGMPLRGSVHTVLTTYYLPDGTQPRESTLEIYDIHCYKLEEYRYEGDGRLHSHREYTRDGRRGRKTVTTSVDPEENQTEIYTLNDLGEEIAIYDGSGVLISRNKTDFPKKADDAEVWTVENVHPDGTVATEKTETFATTNPTTGVTHQTATIGGAPHSDRLIQRDSKGNFVAYAMSYADGSYSKREAKPDGTTVQEDFNAPTKTRTYLTTDVKGNSLEIVREQPGTRTRITYRYDKSGRQIEEADYETSGKLILKNISEYDEDTNGNWIEKRGSKWDSTMGPKSPQRGEVIRRVISYY